MHASCSVQQNRYSGLTFGDSIASRCSLGMRCTTCTPDARPRQQPAPQPSASLYRRRYAMPTGICVLAGSAGVAGTVTFTTAGNKTRVTGEITGLKPGEHGFHIHQVR